MATGHTARHSRLYKCAERSDLAVKADSVDTYVIDQVVARLGWDLLTALSQAPGPDRAEADRLQAKLDGLAQAYAADQITLDQMTQATVRVRSKLAEVEAVQRQYTSTDLIIQTLEELAGITDHGLRRAFWEGLTLSRQRQVVKAMTTAIVLHSPGRGVRTFRPETVEIVWRGAAGADAVATGVRTYLKA